MKLGLLGIYPAKCTCQRINIIEHILTLIVRHSKLECFNCKIIWVFLAINEYLSRIWIFIKQKENLTSNFCSVLHKKRNFKK
jgi:hypothetical protein